MNEPVTGRMRYLGIISILLSALFIALASVFGKIITTNSDIDSLEISFARFFLGLVVITPFMIARKKTLRPVRVKYVLLRSIFNTIAIVLFFMAIQYTSVTKTNMLNMTSPVFVFLVAPFINREKLGLPAIVFLIVTMLGVYLVVTPDFHAIEMGDLFALLSGLASGISASALREARKYDDTNLILFYFYLLATIITFFMMLPVFVLPSPVMVFWIIVSGIFGILGQFFMSWGYAHVSAATGSLVSASRILFGGILGALFFADPMNSTTIIGGLLILVSLIGVSGIFGRSRFFKRRARLG